MCQQNLQYFVPGGPTPLGVLGAISGQSDWLEEDFSSPLYRLKHYALAYELCKPPLCMTAAR